MTEAGSGPEATGLERAARLLRGWEDAVDRHAAGYLDLLGPETPRSSGPVQSLMLTAPLARIYERLWRPALGRAAKGPLGPGMAGEREIAHELLQLRPGDRVLDVACGTGSFTRDFARRVGREGLSIGIDVSETMLARAVAETEGAALPQVAFVRGDAEDLPFRDGSFDGICCFAALNLFSNPHRALDRIAATLRSGGRVALFTSVRGRSTALRAWESLIARQTGMTMFGRDELVDALEARGFTDAWQRITGVTQFVGGRLADG